MRERERVGELEAQLRQLGISSEQVDLLELIPLVEMIWADGHAADAELSLLDLYIEELTERINADRERPIDVPQIESFVLPFLEQPPRQELLQTMRNIGLQRLLERPDAEARKQRLLAACLDIGSAAVKQYPYPMGERFSSDEKRTFFDILHALEEAEKGRRFTN
jgi:hypothetical protein